MEGKGGREPTSAKRSSVSGISVNHRPEARTASPGRVTIPMRVACLPSMTSNSCLTDAAADCTIPPWLTNSPLIPLQSYITCPAPCTYSLCDQRSYCPVECRWCPAHTNHPLSTLRSSGSPDPSIPLGLSSTCQNFPRSRTIRTYRVCWGPLQTRKVYK